MKNLLIVLVLLLGCSKKETENIKVYQITIRYLGKENSPSPQIILINRKPNMNDYPIVNYQVEIEDLKKIEKISYSHIKKYTKGSLILVKINKDNEIKKYFFRKDNAVEILGEIQKIVSHNNNDRLNANLFYLQLATKNSN